MKKIFRRSLACLLLLPLLLLAACQRTVSPDPAAPEGPAVSSSEGPAPGASSAGPGPVSPPEEPPRKRRRPRSRRRRRPRGGLVWGGASPDGAGGPLRRILPGAAL